jgi:hypothetical protein
MAAAVATATATAEPQATTLECPCCGHVLAVPPDVAENALVTCAHCGMVIRNCLGSRAFRWSMVDPYVRRHGATRANLWGGLLGSLAWLPVLAIVMAVTGRFDLLLLCVLAVPYLGLLAWLKARRPRTPQMVWSMELWAGLGTYFVYLGLLHVFLPQRLEVLFAVSGTPAGGPVALLTILVLGGTWLLLGLVGRGWYRRRAQRLPQLAGTPPLE